MTKTQPSAWRAGLPAELVHRIVAAIDQFRADEEYEERHGKLSGTVKFLYTIGAHGHALKEAIETLTPVGMASIHELGTERGVKCRRHELAHLIQRLDHLQRIAALAADRLVHMHSPVPDEGQGAGSAIGRDLDLRAVRAELGRENFAFQFRSPKDKFGVSVLKAYLRHV